MNHSFRKKIHSNLDILLPLKIRDNKVFCIRTQPYNTPYPNAIKLPPINIGGTTNIQKKAQHIAKKTGERTKMIGKNTARVIPIQTIIGHTKNTKIKA